MADDPVTCSTNRIGNVWDIASMENFISSLKTKRTGNKVYRTRSDGFDCVEYFQSQTRHHSTLSCLSPIDFERKAGAVLMSRSRCPRNRQQAMSRSGLDADL